MCVLKKSLIAFRVTALVIYKKSHMLKLLSIYDPVGIDPTS